MVTNEHRMPFFLSSWPRSFALKDDKLAVQMGISLAALTILLIVIHIASYVIFYSTEDPNGLARKILYFVNLGRDHSFSEVLNQGMLFMAALLFLGVSYETRARFPLFLCITFGFAWLDDSSKYHERFGRLISEIFEIHPAFGLRSQDFGELLAWSLAAVVLLTIAFWAYKDKQSGNKIVLLMILKPSIALILCGVVFDMLHIVVEVPWSDLIFTVLEDGGEMLAVAAVVAVSVAVFRNAKKIYNFSTQ